MSERVSNTGPFAIFILAIAFLAFVGGAVGAVANVFPAGYIRDAYRAGTALMDKRNRTYNPYATDLWAKARTDHRRVTVYDADRTQPGLTLYTSGEGARAHLISLDGEIQHTWEKPFSSVWDESAAVRDPVPDVQTYFNKARLLPNGDLLAIYTGVGDTPYGYGMIKLDRDSGVIWKNLDYFHHDFTVAADGRIYGLTHDFRTTSIDGVDHLPKPVLEDFLVVVSPEGRTLQKISLLDAINKSKDYRKFLWRVPFYSLEDPLHVNSVDVLDAEASRALSTRIPVASEGHVLLSFRELAGGSIALLDMDKEEIVWATRGAWLSQHDADVMPNGNIMLFDNRGAVGKGGRSRVIEIDPGNGGGITWTYQGTEERKLESVIRSSQELQPNGNVLITESNGARLLEVTRDGDIVWEFINPVRVGEDVHQGRNGLKGDLAPVVSWGQRIDIESLQAGFRSEILGKSLAKQELSQ